MSRLCFAALSRLVFAFLMIGSGGFLLSSTALAQTTPTFGEKQIGDVTCTNGSSSADFDTLAQCTSTSSSAGTMQKAPLFVGQVTAPPYADTTCDANKAGMLQYTAATMQYCNGTSWTTLSPATLGTLATNTSPSRSDDVTTGLFSAAASTVSIATAGTERMRVTATGSVGIGTTTPAAQLTLVGAGQTAAAFNTAGSLGGSIYLGDTSASTGNGGAVIFGAGSQTYKFAAIKGYITNGTSNGQGDIVFATRPVATDAALTEAMRITAGGNVGIGKSPSYELDVNGTIRAGTSALLSTSGAAGYGQDTTNGFYRAIVGSGTTNGYYFQTNAGGATTMYIGLGGTYNGRVGIGTSGPGANLQVYGTGGSGVPLLLQNSAGGSYWSVGPNSADAFNVVNSSGVGVRVVSGSTAWTAVSDVRLKKNVKTYSVLDRLDRFRAVSFDWKKSGKHEVGVIAQEIYPLFPEVVNKGDDDLDKDIQMGDSKAWGVMYDRFGPLALEGVKELHALVKNLKAENDDLRARIEKLEAARK